MVGNVLEVDIPSNPKIMDLQKGQNSKFSPIFILFFGFLCLLTFLFSPFSFSFLFPKLLRRNLIVLILYITPYLNIQVGNQQVGRSCEVDFLLTRQFFLTFFLFLKKMCFVSLFMFYRLFFTFHVLRKCSCIIYIYFLFSFQCVLFPYSFSFFFLLFIYLFNSFAQIFFFITNGFFLWVNKPLVVAKKNKNPCFPH